MNKLFMIFLMATLLLFVSCTTITPGMATSNPVGSKVGEASVSFLFGWIPLSNPVDLSIKKAAEEGGITQISIVDMKDEWYWLWTTKRTIVNGE